MIRYLYNSNLYACSPKLASKRVIKYTAKDVGNCYRCPTFNYETGECDKKLIHFEGECLEVQEYIKALDEYAKILDEMEEM